MPIYDELISHADRSAIFDAYMLAGMIQNAIFSIPIILCWMGIMLDGEILGVWWRRLKKAQVMIEYQLFRPPKRVRPRPLPHGLTILCS